MKTRRREPPAREAPANDHAGEGNKAVDPLEKPFEPPLGVHPHQDELLDEGVEETFPASDPVSVKRIT